MDNTKPKQLPLKNTLKKHELHARNLNKEGKNNIITFVVIQFAPSSNQYASG